MKRIPLKLNFRGIGGHATRNLGWLRKDVSCTDAPKMNDKRSQERGDRADRST